MAVLLTPQRKVLAMADSQIGYSRWKDDQQGTKYARETQPVFWPKDLWLLANGISFCDLWVTWVFWMALGKDFVTDGGLPAGASYNTDYRASKGGRIPKSQAKPGDVLVFDWNWATLSTNHVGILERKLASGNYQTIEGNTSPGASGSQGNGGGVYRRVRRPDQVRYVIRPNWAQAGGSSSAPATSTPSSAEFADVNKTQAWLRDLGYDPGPVDGKYGSQTAAATRTAQQDLGITPADGRPGPATRTHLEAAVTALNDLNTKLDHLIAFGEQIHWRVDTMPQRVLDADVDLAGINAGKTSSQRTTTAWAGHNHTQTHQLLAAVLTQLAAQQQTIKALAAGQGVTSEVLEQITEAAAQGARRGGIEITAQDVAALLAVTVVPEG